MTIHHELVSASDFHHYQVFDIIVKLNDDVPYLHDDVYALFESCLHQRNSNVLVGSRAMKFLEQHMSITLDNDRGSMFQVYCQISFTCKGEILINPNEIKFAIH